MSAFVVVLSFRSIHRNIQVIGVASSGGGDVKKLPGHIGSVNDDGVDVDWRAVEHQPQLPVTGRRLTPADQDALVERFATLDRLLLPGEQLPWTAPGHAPKTEAAISAYAAVYGTAAGDDV